MPGTVDHLAHRTEGVPGLILRIREINQDKQSSRRQINCSCLTHLIYGRGFRAGTARCDGIHRQLFLDRQEAGSILFENVVIRIDHEMIELITANFILHSSSIRVGENPFAGHCRYGLQLQREEHCAQKEINTFHTD